MGASDFLKQLSLIKQEERTAFCEWPDDVTHGLKNTYGTTTTLAPNSTISNSERCKTECTQQLGTLDGMVVDSGKNITRSLLEGRRAKEQRHSFPSGHQAIRHLDIRHQLAPLPSGHLAASIKQPNR
jgi:hypothetical protein